MIRLIFICVSVIVGTYLFGVLFHSFVEWAAPVWYFGDWDVPSRVLYSLFCFIVVSLGAVNFLLR